VEFKRPRTLSRNIEDRRGAPSGGRRTGIPLGAVGGAGGLIAVVITLLFTVLSGGSGLPGSGFDLGGLSQLDPGAVGGTGAAPLDPATDPNRDEAELASVVLDNAQAFWADLFAASNVPYRDAKLVLFSGATSTACGTGSSATGPFYCGLDEKIYIDLSFWDELSTRFGAAGDFAQAYVIAHEIGHHVQNVLGVSEQVRSQMAQRPNDQNALSVRQELQADCFAGVWANSVWTDGDVGDPNGIKITRDDVSEALQAAAAVGDDRIQEATTGRVDPESFTHGSAEQRVDWFNQGFDSGDPNRCDTFS
jgi:predicted metalloprotease